MILSFGVIIKHVFKSYSKVGGGGLQRRFTPVSIKVRINLLIFLDQVISQMTRQNSSKLKQSLKIVWIHETEN